MDFESVAGDLTSINQSGISTVSNLCKQQIALEKRIADLELELKDAKREHRKVAEDLLPAALQEYGVTELKMEDGSEITVAPYYSASIAKDRQDEAFQWLNDNGFADIIKNTVSVSFGREEDDSAKKLVDSLEDNGYATAQKKWVEPMTLKAFVREQVEKGSDLPLETFNVYIGQKTRIIKK